MDELQQCREFPLASTINALSLFAYTEWLCQTLYYQWEYKHLACKARETGQKGEHDAKAKRAKKNVVFRNVSIDAENIGMRENFRDFFFLLPLPFFLLPALAREKENIVEFAVLFRCLLFFFAFILTCIHFKLFWIVKLHRAFLRFDSVCLLCYTHTHTSFVVASLNCANVLYILWVLRSCWLISFHRHATCSQAQWTFLSSNHFKNVIVLIVAAWAAHELINMCRENTPFSVKCVVMRVSLHRHLIDFFLRLGE